MPGTNVELSKNESRFVNSSEFILTKNRIIEKVYNLFGTLSENYKNILLAYQPQLHREIFKAHPKIYKGENYLHLPYVMMDYPRTFSKDDAFAIRSFFWWGNYFSITLQVSGKYFQTFKNNIHHNLSSLYERNFFICVNDGDVWQHHFEKDNYLPLQKVDINAIFNQPFLKLAAKMPLNKWNNSSKFFIENYTRLLELLKA